MYTAYIISAGYDTTYQFMWIQDDERRNEMISNITCFQHNVTLE